MHTHENNSNHKKSKQVALIVRMAQEFFSLEFLITRVQDIANQNSVYINVSKINHTNLFLIP